MFHNHLRTLWKRVRGTGSGERVYAIGDIHGRADLFMNIIRCIQRDRVARGASMSTRIVLLGDLIDRGPSSRQVVELANLFGRKFEAFTVLCGNHEEMLMQSAAGNGTVQKLWFENGGLATLESYGVNTEKIGDFSAAERGRIIGEAVGMDTLQWLAELPVSFKSGSYFFCHAGVRPGCKLDDQKREDLLWIRDDFLESTDDHGALVIHGHSEGLHVEQLANRINIDTAAYRTGVLTAIGLEQDDRWYLEATLDD